MRCSNKTYPLVGCTCTNVQYTDPRVPLEHYRCKICNESLWLNKQLLVNLQRERPKQRNTEEE